MSSHSSNTSGADLSASPTLDLDAFAQAVKKPSSSANTSSMKSKPARSKSSQRPLLWNCVDWDREFNQTSEDAGHSRLFPRVADNAPSAAARRSSRVAESKRREPESGADAAGPKVKAPKFNVTKTRRSKGKERDKGFGHAIPMEELDLRHMTRSPTPEDTIRVVPLPQAPLATPYRSKSKARRKSRPPK
ncbi:MAG: hypothetical protein M1836_007063 [Candelina mexicana]|nr:MAG: hypothetical protein M1836_007063 [Candelina mexicana]